MTKNHTLLTSAFVLSAAALFVGGCKEKPSTTTPEPTTGGGGGADPVVKCFGINECAGQSACNVSKPELGIEHSCAGENTCRGKGWLKVPQAECTAKSGEVLT